LNRRLLAVAVATVLGVAGIVAVLAYVHQSDDRSVAGLQVREAYIAVRIIPADTSLSAALDGRMMSLQAASPDGAL
jgi:hypothetical protein